MWQSIGGAQMKQQAVQNETADKVSGGDERMRWANITQQSEELRRGQSVSVSHPPGAFSFIFSTIGILAGRPFSQTLKESGF